MTDIRDSLDVVFHDGYFGGLTLGQSGICSLVLQVDVFTHPPYYLSTPGLALLTLRSVTRVSVTDVANLGDSMELLRGLKNGEEVELADTGTSVDVDRVEIERQTGGRMFVDCADVSMSWGLASVGYGQTLRSLTSANVGCSSEDFRALCADAVWAALLIEPNRFPKPSHRALVVGAGSGVQSRASIGMMRSLNRLDIINSSHHAEPSSDRDQAYEIRLGSWATCRAWGNEIDFLARREPEHPDLSLR